MTWQRRNAWLTPRAVRDYLVAPLAEEWVFRACMLPLLLAQVLLACLEHYCICASGDTMPALWTGSASLLHLASVADRAEHLKDAALTACHALLSKPVGQAPLLLCV